MFATRASIACGSRSRNSACPAAAKLLAPYRQCPEARREILEPGAQGKCSRHHPEIPEHAQDGQDERPVQQGGKNKTMRIETPAENIEQAYSCDPYSCQAKVVHP